MSNPDAHIRSLDEVGRVMIPSHMREVLGWKPGSRLEIVMDSAAPSIHIRQAVPRCSLCGKESEGLQIVANGLICPECARQIH